MSKDFPVTPDAPQGTNAGDDGSSANLLKLGDAFLAEIGPPQDRVWNILGGSSGDWAGGVAVDGTGGVIIGGGTTSKDFPSSTGALQSKYAGRIWGFPRAMVSSRAMEAQCPRFSIAGVSNAASFAAGAVAPGEAILIRGNEHRAGRARNRAARSETGCWLPRSPRRSSSSTEFPLRSCTPRADTAR